MTVRAVTPVFRASCVGSITVQQSYTKNRLHRKRHIYNIHDFLYKLTGHVHHADVGAGLRLCMWVHGASCLC